MGWQPFRSFFVVVPTDAELSPTMFLSLMSNFLLGLTTGLTSFIKNAATIRRIPPKTPDSKSEEKLIIIDSRTSRRYDIPITHNSVQAIDFKSISILGLGSDPRARSTNGLKILDPGFQNTAVTQSQITYV